MRKSPALIGLFIHKKKYYYLSWIPSELGPLVIDYGSSEISNKLEIPYMSLFNQIRKYNIDPCYSLSLRNDDVKYNFTSENRIIRRVVLEKTKSIFT